ncbi:MAG: mechanosensitive ion channel family protein [Gammaproteobacteria bacterium]|nr:mechanosensitive ion channel family protein [Gammaproteobacteria bacterium]
MTALWNIVGDILARFDFTDALVICTNVLLMLFSRRIMSAIYHEPPDNAQFRWRVNIFRLFNLLIIFLFSYYHLHMVQDSKGWAFQALTISVILYFSYLGLHLLHFFVRRRYGKKREVEGQWQVVETYNSRLLNIFASIFVFIIALISVIRVLGFDSLLEAGGVIGFIGVFLALTQGAWAPDMFSGLIILNSGMVEVGDVIELDEGSKSISVVYKTKVFHTELLNLVNNHRIMIKNSRLREHTIHNLSKFASARGLRENLHFKIDYSMDETRVRSMFEKAYAKACADAEIAVDAGLPFEVAVMDTGDYAVEWCVYYYTKEVKQLLKTRYRMRETILQTSKECGISLATPVLHTSVS